MRWRLRAPQDRLHRVETNLACRSTSAEFRQPRTRAGPAPTTITETRAGPRNFVWSFVTSFVFLRYSNPPFAQLAVGSPSDTDDGANWRNGIMFRRKAPRTPAYCLGAIMALTGGQAALADAV